MPQDWKSRRKSLSLRLSATQLETAELCIRKWWLRYVRGLAEPGGKSETFGTVLHAVIERYLAGDNQGRDKDGKPIELYPAGWTQARNRYKPELIDGEVTPAEADLIQSLIKSAIEGGVLEIPDSRLIEHPFDLSLLDLPCRECNGAGTVECSTCRSEGVWHGPKGEEFDCEDCKGAKRKTCPLCKGDGHGERVTVTGFIDLLTDEGIQDHKSTKSMKYAKSKDALRDNIQMNIYGRVFLELYKHLNEPTPAAISLRHNVYCKDPDDLRVRKTEVRVSPDHIEQKWQYLQMLARQMVALRRNANGWSHCPEPRNMSQACNAYGGCPYRSICAGRESEEMYERRVAEIVKNSANNLLNVEQVNGIMNGSTIPTPDKGESCMGIADKIRAAQNGTAAAAPAPAPANTPPASINPPSTGALPQPPQVSQGYKDAAPWAMASCAACQGLGFNTQGEPCKICNVKQKQKGGPTSDQYSLTPVGDGTVFWQHKESGKEGISPMTHDAGERVVAVETKVELPPAPVAASAPAPAPVASSAPSPAPAPETANNSTTHIYEVSGVTSIPAHGTLSPAAAVSQVPDAPQAEEPKKRKRRTKEEMEAARATEAGGSPRSGFVLVIGGVVSKPGDASVQFVHDIFNQVAEGFASEARNNKQLPENGTFFDLDSFRRKDTILAMGAEIVKEFITAEYVVVGAISAVPDIRALIDAIRPYAAIEINAVAA